MQLFLLSACYFRISNQSCMMHRVVACIRYWYPSLINPIAWLKVVVKALYWSLNTSLIYGIDDLLKYVISVVEHWELNEVWTELLNSWGNEIYMKVLPAYSVQSQAHISYVLPHLHRSWYLINWNFCQSCTKCLILVIQGAFTHNYHFGGWWL